MLQQGPTLVTPAQLPEILKESCSDSWSRGLSAAIRRAESTFQGTRAPTCAWASGTSSTRSSGVPSVHTLTVPESNSGITDVWFAVTGANLNMNEKGDVASVVDARSVLASYRELCRTAGQSCVDNIVIGES
jgi:hypothetical protein